MDQDISDAEIIVVCNNPVINDQSSLFPCGKFPVTWLHVADPGSAPARNKGLQSAKGEWIQFLDADDILLPGKISGQLGLAGNGAVVSPHIYRHVDGKMERSKWLGDDIWKGLLNSGLGSTSSMLWHRQSVQDVGGWSASYQSHQEYELLFRLAAAGFSIKAKYDDKTIVRERKAGSITKQTRPVRAKEGIRLREEMWNYIKNKSLVTRERKVAFLQYIFRQLRGLSRTDFKEAMKLYAQYFSHEQFAPQNIGFPFYDVLYRLMGFRTTEKLLGLYAKMRDRHFPFLPKNT